MAKIKIKLSLILDLLVKQNSNEMNGLILLKIILQILKNEKYKSYNLLFPSKIIISYDSFCI